MEVVLLHNENAGNGNWSKKDLVRLIRDAGYEPHYFSVKAAIEDPDLLDQGEFVIVAGGDGSVRKSALALLGRNRALAPLPLGTANNIVRSFNLPSHPEEIVAGWRNAKRRRFDVGVIEGPWGKRHFIEGIGIGLISRCIAVIEHIDRLADYELKKAKHRLHRDLCVATALAHEMHPLPAELNFDGRRVAEAFLLLEILNIRRAGPGMELAPQASPSDGRFDVVTVTAAQRGKLVEFFDARLTGHDPTGSLTTRRARKLRLKVGAPCDIRIDDGTFEVAADTTLEVTLKRGALEFLLPGLKPTRTREEPRNQRRTRTRS